MPFKSKSQMRACFAKHDKGWDCHKWAKETGNTKKLPERMKKGNGGKFRPKYQRGGSIVDYLNRQGKDASYEARKKMYTQKYGTNDYSGTAEQNLKLLADLQTTPTGPGMVGRTPQMPWQQASGMINPAAPAPAPARPQPTAPPRTLRDIGRSTGWVKPHGPAPRADSKVVAPWAQPSNLVNFGAPVVDRGLESGVIVDKRTGKARVVKNFQTVKEFPVLTGQNVEGNSNLLRVDAVDGSEKNTPVGYYNLAHSNPVALKEFNNNVLDMNPIRGPHGEPAPQATGLAFHETYDPKNRLPLYGTSKPWVSYGCVNGRCNDVKEVMGMFPQGDTMQVVDSKYRPRKQRGGMIPLSWIDQLPAENQLQAQNLIPVNPPIATSYFPKQDLALPAQQRGLSRMGISNGMRAGNDLLAEISGRVDRGRQNQYMYDQYSTLGQMDEMPVQNFQPNPFSLYARYGGSLRRYQQGGPMDGFAKEFARRKGTMNPEDTYAAPNAPFLGTNGQPFVPRPSTRQVQYNLPNGVDPSQLKSYGQEFWYDDPHTGDAVFVDPSVFNRYRGQQPALASMAKLKEGGINPAHKGWCTPMTKSTCTGKRRQFALNMKKMARENKNG
jgi:hypothetical protein